jgi:hypothetical protein
VIPPDFIQGLLLAPPEDILAKMQARQGWTAYIVELVNEVRPADLFCYLGARFGPPNGVQNLLRGDTSNNLIHWEWTLKHGDGLVCFQGQNYRTEIHLPQDVKWQATDREDLVTQIKSDFGRHGKEMGEIRKLLEPWVEFVNPYQRIRRAVERLREQLDSLGLDVANRDVSDNTPPDILAIDDPEARAAAHKQWEDMGSRYLKAFPLCFGIRAMLPVMAESFVNLVMHILMRPEIKSDVRLRENAVRQPIDVRIKSMSINCIGFGKAVDYASDACRAYHTLVNERNDLLHGNIVVDKLKFNEVYFWGKVPVFHEYRSMWHRARGIQARMVGLDRVSAEQEVVDNFINYLLSCLEPDIQQQLKLLADAHELGFNTSTQRFGLLFDDTLVDFRVAGATPQGKSQEAE